MSQPDFTNSKTNGVVRFEASEQGFNALEKLSSLLRDEEASFVFSLTGPDVDTVNAVAVQALAVVPREDKELFISKDEETTPNGRFCFSMEIIANDEGLNVLKKLSQAVSDIQADGFGEDCSVAVKMMCRELPYDSTKSVVSTYEQFASVAKGGISLEILDADGAPLAVNAKGRSLDCKMFG